MFVLFAIIVMVFLYAIINNQTDHFDSTSQIDTNKCNIETNDQPVKEDDHTIYDNIHKWLDNDSKYGDKYINSVIGYSLSNKNQTIPISNINIPQLKIVNLKNPRFEYINSIFTKNSQYLNQQGYGVSQKQKYQKLDQNIIDLIKLHQPCIFDKPNYFKIGKDWHYYDSRYPMYPVNVKFLTNPSLFSQNNYNQYPSYRYIMKY